MGGDGNPFGFRQASHVGLPKLYVYTAPRDAASVVTVRSKPPDTYGHRSCSIKASRARHGRRDVAAWHRSLGQHYGSLVLRVRWKEQSSPTAHDDSILRVDRRPSTVDRCGRSSQRKRSIVRPTTARYELSRRSSGRRSQADRLRREQSVQLKRGGCRRSSRRASQPGRLRSRAAPAFAGHRPTRARRTPSDALRRRSHRCRR